VLNFPVAFANNLAVHMVFRFLTGFAGSAFLSVSGGAVSDVFTNAKVGT
jgi:predicted MFS family arabinose efflux permease